MKIYRIVPIVTLLLTPLASHLSGAQERQPQTARATSGICGTYPGRARTERIQHQFTQGLKEFRRSRGVWQEALLPTEDRDDGAVAIIEDDGSIVAEPNPLDLVGQTLRFEPAVPSGFNISIKSTVLDTSLGTVVSMGDDATYRIAFSGGFTFRFFSTAYNEVYLNTNGNLTFGKGDPTGGIDSGIYGQELSNFLNGPPRIAALFADFNPGSTGGIYVKAQADRLVITWSQVFLFGSSQTNTFQVTLFSSGAIELAYADTLTARQGVVGVSPGGPNATLSVVDFSRAPITAVSGAIGERYNLLMEVDVLALSRKFYRSHADAFEFLAVFSNFNFNMGGVIGYELNVSNSTRGLGDLLLDGPGQDFFDDAGLYGSAGKLESFVMMGPLSNYPDDPSLLISGQGTKNTVNLIGEEVGHRWGAYVRARVNGASSDRLLGRALAHWSFFHDTDASDLEGNKIRDNANGSFTTTDASKQYSSLDQYLMGLRDAAEVAPFYFVESPTGTSQRPGDPPAIGATFSGIRRSVSVQDVIAEEGMREPTPATAPKIFRMAFIVLVRKGAQATAADLSKVQTIRAAWEKHFAKATGNRGFMDTRLIITDRPTTSYLPLLEGDAQRFTGVALANRAAFPAAVKFTLLGDDGQPLQLPGITNPSTVAIGPGQQRALTDAQIFRYGSSEARQGWIRLESSNDQTVGFFLVGNSSQAYLDGGLSQSQPLSQMYFTRALEGSSVLFGQNTITEINLANPGSRAAAPQFTLYDNTGRVAATASGAVPANGRIHKTLAQIFAGLPLPVSSGYLEVRSELPLLGFELIQFGQTLYGLPAQARASAARLYSAQFASGGSAVFPAPFFTDLNLVNVSDTAVDVTVRVVRNDGTLLQMAGVTNPLVRRIDPRAVLSGRADRLFGFPRDTADAAERVGSLIVDISGGAVLGDVVFGDAANGNSAAALPLQSTLLSDVLFAQIAEGQSGTPAVSYFTGIAALNPNATAVQLTVDVYRENGEVAGSRVLSMPPGGRLSQTIGELVSSVAGQMRGYIRVRTSGGPVALFELFGDSGLTRFLSAVPPQVLVSSP